MKVLRAHFYFELSRLFNKVPYIDENLSTAEYVNVRNDEYSRNELLGLINNVTELNKDAINSIANYHADFAHICQNVRMR